ncbi:MAG: DUF6398 domain-containing protein [Methanobacteriota archaeon]
MYLSASPDTTLRVIDLLLKQVWGGNDEMCSFFVEGEEYTSYPDSSRLNVRVEKIFCPGRTCTYTDKSLLPTVIHIVFLQRSPDYIPAKGSVCVIARNSRIAYDCDICGSFADFFCDECYQEGRPPLICKHCLPVHDCSFEQIQIIPNSPRFGVDGYIEAPDLAIRWYPAGWARDEIVPPDLYALLNQYYKQFMEEEDEDEFPTLPNLKESMIGIREMFGDEINLFIIEECTDLGTRHLKFYREVVLQFLFHQERYYGTELSDWEEILIRTIMCEHLVFLPKLVPFPLGKVIEILSRFFRYLQKRGFLDRCDNLITELYESAWVFMENCNLENYEYYITLVYSSDIHHVELESDLYDPLFLPLSMIFDKMEEDDLIGSETKQATDSIGMDRFTPNKTSLYNTSLSGHLPIIRYDAIRTEIERFCRTGESSDVLYGCIRMLDELAEYSFSPLHKGNCPLWASAIVYSVYQDNRLIIRGSATFCAERIATFFGVSPNMTRSRSSELKKAVNKIFLIKNPGFYKNMRLQRE